MLVSLLGDPDVGVRDAAIESLYTLTTEDFSYEADAAIEKRQESIRRWEEWLRGPG